MPLRTLLIAGLACAGLAAGQFAAVALSSGAVTCSGTQSSNVAGDLYVPAGRTCTIDPGVRIGHDVNVSSGATLIDNGAIVGHDIRANSPKGIGIGGSASGPGSVGWDIDVRGTSGAGPGSTLADSSYICNTRVVNDVNVAGSAAKAGPWIVGDADEDCGRGGNQVGHDLNIQGNHDRVDVADNLSGTPPYAVGVNHDLNVGGNTVTTASPVVESNFVGHEAICQRGTKRDADGTPNVVSGDDDGCN